MYHHQRCEEKGRDSLLPGTSANEAQTVKDYTTFVVDAKGGQALASEGDYAPLPKGVDAEADAGASLIGF